MLSDVMMVQMVWLTMIAKLVTHNSIIKFSGLLWTQRRWLVKYMKQMYVCGYIHVYGNNNVGKQNREADIIRASAESQCCQLNKKQNENQQENNTQRYVVLSR